MYTQQSLRVKWGNTLSEQIFVMNCVKQGVVLSPVLFTVYNTDGLLKRLENTGVGCKMGCQFADELPYADDITLLAPCKSALSICVNVCKNYAAEYDIMFNVYKGRLLFFKSRSSAMVPSEIRVNGEIVGESDKTVNLRYIFLTTDHDCIPS